MTKNATITTWAIVIIAILAILGIWWYYSRPANTASVYNSTNTTNNTESQQPTLSSEKQITSFKITSLSPSVEATINASTYAILVTVPKNTDVKKLTPTITTSANATVSPASGTEKDFTLPLVYTVTAEDGTSQNYMVTVVKAAQ